MAGRLARLERAGLLRRGRASALPNPLLNAPPWPGANIDVVETLIEERRERDEVLERRTLINKMWVRDRPSSQRLEPDR